VRLALGAGRARLARQVLTESLVLAGLGALAGIALTMWMGGALQYLLPPSHFPFALDVGVNSHMLGFTVLVCVVAAVLYGVAPAVQSTRADLNESLKEGGRGGAAGQRSHRLRGLLVISEVSLALVARGRYLVHNSMLLRLHALVDFARGAQCGSRTKRAGYSWTIATTHESAVETTHSASVASRVSSSASCSPFPAADTTICSGCYAREWSARSSF